MTTDQLYQFRKDMSQIMELKFKERIYAEGGKGYERNRSWARQFLGAIENYNPSIRSD